MADLHYWYREADNPFILVLYDAVKHCAYWIDAQAYVDERRTIDEHPSSDTVTLHIPKRNKLNLHSIDQFRSMSLARTRLLD